MTLTACDELGKHKREVGPVYFHISYQISRGKTEENSKCHFVQPVSTEYLPNWSQMRLVPVRREGTDRNPATTLLRLDVPRIRPGYFPSSNQMVTTDSILGLFNGIIQLHRLYNVDW